MGLDRSILIHNRPRLGQGRFVFHVRRRNFGYCYTIGATPLYFSVNTFLEYRVIQKKVLRHIKKKNSSTVFGRASAIMFLDCADDRQGSPSAEFFGDVMKRDRNSTGI